MRLTTIPDEAMWPGSTRHVLMPPGGTLDSEATPIEMLMDRHVIDGIGYLRYLARFELEPGDLEKLTHGGTIWVSLLGAVVPFDVNVLDEAGGQ
jgi:hypothetical protein